jgi:hypothetical protein
MPVRLGDLFLFGFLVLLMYVFFGAKQRTRESMRISPIQKEVLVASQKEVSASDKSIIATVVEEEAPAIETREQPAATSKPFGQPTDRQANVAGIWGTVACVEYLRDGVLETRVHQIDECGHQLDPTRVYTEPYEKVLDAYVGSTSW